MATYTITATSGRYLAGNTTVTGRGMCRLSTGRLLVPIVETNTITVWYSDDDGQTWGTLTGTIGSSSGSACSIFATTTDEVLLMRAGSGGTLDLRSGTISGTTITWGTPVGLGDTNEYGGDMCGWRVGTDTYAACVYWQAVAERIELTILKKADGGSWGITPVYGPVNVESSVAYGEPSIDFHHTGDGKTVQGGTPHLYIAYHVASTATSTFKKYTYSAGPTWTAGGARSMQGMIAAGGSQYRYGPVGVFDGSDFYMVNADNATPYIRVAKRDAADTTTTALNPGVFGTATPHAGGIMVDDATGDIIVWARSDADGDLYYNVYDGTWAGWTLGQTGVSSDRLNALRHRSGNPTAAALHQPVAGGVYYVEGPAFPVAGYGWGFVPVGG